MVVGNGQWDCLHNPTHFEDYKTSLHELTGLLEELKRRKGTGLVFVTPPTVNDLRLGTDKKKEFMTEEVSVRKSRVGHEQRSLANPSIAARACLQGPANLRGIVYVRPVRRLW